MKSKYIWLLVVAIAVLLSIAYVLNETSNQRNKHKVSISTSRASNEDGVGTLTIVSDPLAIPPRFVVMNEIYQNVGSFQVVAGPAEDVAINRIIVTDTQTGDHADSALVNIRLYDGASQVGNTVVSLDNVGKATFFLNPSLLIQKNSVKTFKIVADIMFYNPKASTSGTTHTFGIEDAETDVLGTGLESGEAAIASGSSIGHTHTVYRTKLNVLLDPNSPRDTFRSVSRNDTVAIYDFVADRNHDLTLQSFNLNISVSGVTVTNTVRLYYSHDLTTPIPVKIKQSEPGHYLITMPSSYTIRAGETKQLLIKVDSINLDWTHSGDVYNVQTSSITNVSWSDQGGSTEISLPASQLPVRGGTNRY